MVKPLRHGTANRSAPISAAFGEIERFLQAKLEDIENQAGYATFVATNVGHQRMLQIIETSTTPTGDERAAHGGHPGRIDTGNMIDQVRHDIHTLGATAENRVFIGEWGWLDGHEKYFEIQEDGWNKIRAMDSINQSYIAAREALFEELSK